MKYFISFFLLWLTACSTSQKATVPTPAPVPEVLSAWLQWTPDSILEARAVVSTAECPAMKTEQGSFPMKARASVTAEFPYLVCQLPVPNNATSVQVQNIVLKIPTHKISRIVIFGDTGCRLKANKDGSGSYQACNDPMKWPLKTVAEAAAQLHPDLVIHVGDYHYREAACPPGHDECKGAAEGYGWKAWQEDFFTPTQALLQAAPWIFVRGNHELCNRAGEGWFRTLEPRAYQKCVDETPDYSVRFGSHELTVVDSADAKNLGPALRALPVEKNHRWILSHRPFLTANTSDKEPSVALLPQALLKPGQIGLVMAGHIHILMLNRFKDQRPLELIMGNGGSALDQKIEFFKEKAGDKFWTYNDFGFVSLEQKSGEKWTLNVHDTKGQIVKACEMKESIGHKTTLKCQGE